MNNIKEVVKETGVKGENAKSTRYNSNIILVGEVISEFKFDHNMYGELFYRVIIKVTRISGVADELPVVVSERIIDANENYIGKYVYVEGQIRTYNVHKDGRSKLNIYGWADSFKIIDEEADYNRKENNKIELNGFICSKPIYRKTPSGREITDLIIAVNRSYGRSSYIPCISWGRNAVYMANLDAGTPIKVTGRFQSRLFNKKINETEVEQRTAYEVSITSFEVKKNEGEDE